MKNFLGRPRNFHWLVFTLGLGLTAAPMAAKAQHRNFQRGGTNLTLPEISQTAEVYFPSICLSRALNQWNFEFKVRNTATAPLLGAVLVFQSVTNAMGPLVADGFDSTGKPRLGLFARLPALGLLTGQESALRTVRSGWSPAPRNSMSGCSQRSRPAA